MSTIENELIAAGGRLLKPEYLIRMQASPLVPLSLEAIGDNLRMARKIENARLTFRQIRLASKDFEPFVRRVIGVDVRAQLQWAYVRGNRSYAKANGCGSRGVFYHYTLERGPVYEINAPTTWGKVDRYYVRFLRDAEQRMGLWELVKCVQN